VALTEGHVTTEQLPSFSVDEKVNDARAGWFRRQFGRRCWELDALSPNRLREDVESAIVNRLDQDAWDRAAIAEAAEQESLATILNAWPGISRQAQK
jgi:hypothetical protein